MKKPIKRTADEHVGRFQVFRNSKLIIVKRTSSFARESIKASFTAAVCLSIFFVSVSCASLPKNERSGDNRTQTESIASSRQSEHRDIVSESAENENAAMHEKNGDALQRDESSSAAGTSESVLAKEANAADTGGKKEDTASNTEYLSERVRNDLPEKSEEAMRGSTSIDEPVVRDAVSENKDAGSTARSAQTSTKTTNDSSKTSRPTQTSVNAAGGETTRSAEDARGRSTNAAQKKNGNTSKKTINHVKNADDARSAKDKDVVSADKSASSTDASQAADLLVEAKEIVAPVIPSRSVNVAKNQYLDVVYPGGGWIYLGETDGTKRLSFFGKKLGETDTTFTLRAKNAGKAVLHFYKNDILTGDAIDDWLEVIVEDKVGSAAERITAPSYADIVPPRPAHSDSEAPEENKRIDFSESEGNDTDRFSETAGDGAQRFSGMTESGAPVSGRTTDSESGVSGAREMKQASADENNAVLSQNAMRQASADENDSASSQSAQKQTGSASAADLSADDYVLDESGLLEKAKSAYDKKNYARALAILDLFFARATSRLDEGLYLKGQALEAKSDLQNIKGAIRAYDELLQKWPESKQWQSARKRSIYLKRMYVDIR